MIACRPGGVRRRPESTAPVRPDEIRSTAPVPVPYPRTMPEPDERLAPAPPEATPPPPAEGDGLPAGWRAVVPDLRPLRRHREYRLLTVGQSVSFLGSMVTYVAVPY